MSDIGRTEPLEERHPGTPDSRPQEHRPAGVREDLGATGTHRDRDRKDPVEAAKDPDNRAKLLLGIAAVTLLNLILLLVVLASVMGDNFEAVVVEGEKCVIGEREGENVLYCER
jgi:hypothetical protein